MAASPPHQHHGFLLKQMLNHVEAQEAEIAALDERIEAALAPFAAQVELLATIPGVDHRCAQVLSVASFDDDGVAVREDVLS